MKLSQKSSSEDVNLGKMSDNSEIVVGVTGAAGFTGSHTVHKLLQQGYTVHATVRDVSHPRAEKLKEFPGNDRLQLFAADLNVENSFDDAFKGCKYVIHVATTVKLTSKNPADDILKPALGGTLNVLKSCAKCEVEKVVLTSSMGAIDNQNLNKNAPPLDETSWNTHSTLESDPYSFSKTQAEKAAWQFAGNNQYADKQNDSALVDKSCHEMYGRNLRLTAINPGYIIGPTLMDNAPTGLSVFGRFLNGQIPMVPSLHFCYVDIREVVDSFIKAMLNPDSDGERFLVCNDKGLWMQEVAQTISKKFPTYKVATRHCPNFLVYIGAMFDKDVPLSFMWNHLNHETRLNSQKSRDILGIEYRNVTESIIDTCQSLIDQEIVPRK